MDNAERAPTIVAMLLGEGGADAILAMMHAPLRFYVLTLAFCAILSGGSVSARAQSAIWDATSGYLNQTGSLVLKIRI